LGGCVAGQAQRVLVAGTLLPSDPTAPRSGPTSTEAVANVLAGGDDGPFSPARRRVATRTIVGNPTNQEGTMDIARMAEFLAPRATVTS
jgi:hypothetical protein